MDTASTADSNSRAPEGNPAEGGSGDADEQGQRDDGKSDQDRIEDVVKRIFRAAEQMQIILSEALPAQNEVEQRRAGQRGGDRIQKNTEITVTTAATG